MPNNHKKNLLSRHLHAYPSLSVIDIASWLKGTSPKRGDYNQLMHGVCCGRIHVMTRDIKISGLRRKPVTGCPSFLLLDPKRLVSLLLISMQLLLVLGGLRSLMELSFAVSQVQPLCTPSSTCTQLSPATSRALSPLRKSSFSME